MSSGRAIDIAKPSSRHLVYTCTYRDHRPARVVPIQRNVAQLPYLRISIVMVFLHKPLNPVFIKWRWHLACRPLRSTTHELPHFWISGPSSIEFGDNISDTFRFWNDEHGCRDGLARMICMTWSVGRNIAASKLGIRTRKTRY